MSQGHDSDDLKFRLSAVPGKVEQLNGKRIHIATPHRWATRGLSGVRLRVQYIGGQRHTTDRWLEEFFEAVTAAKLGNAPQSDPTTRSADAQSRAEAELEAAGI